MIASKRVPGKRKLKGTPLFAVLLGALVLGLAMAALMNGHDVALFNPKGLIADEQHRLMVTSTLIMLGFGLPVILTIYFFAWKYREDNQASTHTPKTKNNNAYLLFAWGGPLITVIILASLMVPATHRLQPQKPIQSDNDHITVEVVAVRWKWLFIYPEQRVASVNFVQMPVDTPVRFELTADEMPMSSFWIPNLGGMLYTMTGHINPLNLVGNTIGDYPGKTAEINGKGYAGMKFTARVSTLEDFDAWVAKTRQSPAALTAAEYQKLLEPSENNKPAFYKDPSPDLFDTIIAKYPHEMDQHDMDMMDMEGMK